MIRHSSSYFRSFALAVSILSDLGVFRLFSQTSPSSPQIYWSPILISEKQFFCLVFPCCRRKRNNLNEPLDPFSFLGGCWTKRRPGWRLITGLPLLPSPWHFVSDIAVFVLKLQQINHDNLPTHEECSCLAHVADECIAAARVDKTVMRPVAKLLLSYFQF